MTSSKQHEDRQSKITRVIEETYALGRFSDGKHDMTIYGDSEIRVYERDGLLVAYSSTKADFEQSLVEFATDYFA